MKTVLSIYCHGQKYWHPCTVFKEHIFLKKIPLVSTILYFTVKITEPLFLKQNLRDPVKSENKNKWHLQNY